MVPLFLSLSAPVTDHLRAPSCSSGSSSRCLRCARSPPLLPLLLLLLLPPTQQSVGSVDQRGDYFTGSKADRQPCVRTCLRVQELRTLRCHAAGSPSEGRHPVPGSAPAWCVCVCVCVCVPVVFGWVSVGAADLKESSQSVSRSVSERAALSSTSSAMTLV